MAVESCEAGYHLYAAMRNVRHYAATSELEIKN